MKHDPKVTKALNHLLADATIFYQKLRHYHWNVEGHDFFELHGKFEELYTVWANHIDVIAERIRTLRAVPLHTLAGILKAARLSEDDSIPSASEMVEVVIADLEALQDAVGDVVKAADHAGDRGTAHLMDHLGDSLEKSRWMLRSWHKESARSWS